MSALHATALRHLCNIKNCILDSAFGNIRRAAAHQDVDTVIKLVERATKCLDAVSDAERLVILHATAQGYEIDSTPSPQEPER